MKYKNEKQIKKALGIESWRNLSKDKVVQFASMMPEMNKEVMLEIIKSLPEFTKYGNELLEALHDTIQKSIDRNSSDYQAGLEIIKETQSILKEQLNRENITDEERILIINNLMELARMIPSMDKQNKKLIEILNNNALKATGVALLAVIVFVGGKVFLDKFSGEDPDNKEDDAIDVDCKEV